MGDPPKLGGEPKPMWFRGGDAPYIITSPAEWGDAWKKRTLVFYRGTVAPIAPYPGRVGTSDWHNGGSRDLHATSRQRDETQPCFAAGLAEQIQPTVPSPQPLFPVEVERMAAAFHDAGLLVPTNYAAPDGQPIDSASQA